MAAGTTPSCNGTVLGHVNEGRNSRHGNLCQVPMAIKEAFKFRTFLHRGIGRKTI
ncbi:MAG: hypothetical protein ISS55_04825 [Dehalococcoidales bacterium]|nr:hypothetical protein [Dehalococcoidales bacterium]